MSSWDACLLNSLSPLPTRGIWLSTHQAVTSQYFVRRHQHQNHRGGETTLIGSPPPPLHCIASSHAPAPVVGLCRALMWRSACQASVYLEPNSQPDTCEDEAVKVFFISELWHYIALFIDRHWHHWLVVLTNFSYPFDTSSEASPHPWHTDDLIQQTNVPGALEVPPQEPTLSPEDSSPVKPSLFLSPKESSNW